MATSYNGWVASPDAGSIGIVSFSVLGTRPFSNGGFAGGLKGGDVSVVFKELVTRLHNEVEPMMNVGGLGYGCWAYEYRANVNNPSTLSCHASGTAIDYNATKHANGTSVGPSGGGGWTGAQYQKIQGILADLGGVVRWLTSNDPMHFEISGSALAVAVVADRIRGGAARSAPDTDNGEDDMFSDVDRANLTAAQQQVGADAPKLDLIAKQNGIIGGLLDEVIALLGQIASK